MTAQAYARTIWRHARKKKRPAMWRYAVRTFDRMPAALKTNVHYEGVLAACAKLGWSERARQVYETVVEKQAKSVVPAAPAPAKPSLSRTRC